MSRIKDASLSNKGKQRVEWARTQMKVLEKIRKRFDLEKPFSGMRIGACMHVTTETANLILSLKDGGAEISLSASNPLSTQDDVAAYLVKEGINVFAIRGDSSAEYAQNLEDIIKERPQIIMDDGSDLTVSIHKNKEALSNVVGGTEETTTGVIRLKSMQKDGELKYPVIAVNDAMTKQMFDNRYGTGQSTIDGIIRATNILIAGKTFVVAGYGWCSRGIATRARGMGANVVVTEVDPIRALEAVMDGFRVMTMVEASKLGDLFSTATGDREVINGEHIQNMKDGAILSNSGHFNVEIDVAFLEKYPKKTVRTNVEEYLVDGKRIYLLAQGRLVNLGAAEGHPAAVMDMSFADQALACEYIIKNKLSAGVHNLPEEIDREIARTKLQTMGIEIDKLTKSQEKYLSSWKEGT
ncbi:MAG: adenosylhomocysteinase [Candidatus Altiarchaeota archaeon]|nr:adenosylhomocysteinase [Candidatus Altiarchaeota archaeon]